MGADARPWFWAKTGPEGAFLPLRRHLDDAGAVADRLWEVALTARQRAWFAKQYGRGQEETRSWLVFLAAAHDLGKASPNFQMQVEELARRLLPAHLFRPRGQVAPPHDAVSGAILVDWLRGKGASSGDANRLAATISGHHAIPKPSVEVRKAGRQMPGPWKDVQRELISSLADDFGVTDLAVPAAVSVAGSLATAGLVCVADWIASDQGRFPVTDGARESSGVLAGAAVVGDSWSARPVEESLSFESAFNRVPRATQRAVVDLLADQLAEDEQFLLLVEDRPGSGKTEAAYMAVQHALAAGSRGFYVGMPTQATANQLHSRTIGFLATLWPDADVVPRLLHGGVHLDEDCPAPIDIGRDNVEERDAAIRAAEARSWFAQTRRGLLSPYGVGTVDQALLAVLSARHYPVRVFGLQNKVVVLDEVHAYDAYTGLLLRRLVAWLASLGCSVVLLSATLPPSRRRDLIADYLASARVDGSAELVDTASQGYPRVTLATRTKVNEIGVVDDRPGREVELAWESLPPAEGEADDAIAARAMSEVADGGCLAIVCSTVSEAQRLYVALERQGADSPGDGVEVELLHSRMRRLERGPIEERLLAKLGPPGTVAREDCRPRRMIVVATQVIEQSLDIDFDVMFSHLAPVDLLIQRAGRLHRHSRPNRPKRHGQPRLHILDTSGDSPLRPISAGTRAVYVEAVLVRTRLALLGRQSLREPDDLDQLIALVYEPHSNPGRDEDERVEVERLDRRAAEERTKMEGWAEAAMLSPPDGLDPPWEETPTALEDPERPGSTAMNSAATRYSERPSISIVPLFPDELPDARRTPSAKQVGMLLERAAPVSSVRITRPILDAAERGSGRGRASALQPSRWRKISRLRYQFLIELDADGRPLPIASGPDGQKSVLRFRLDKQLGVVEGGEA